MIKLIMFAFNKISYKDKRETIFFMLHIYKHIYKDFWTAVGKKIQSSPWNCYEIYIYFLGNAFSSVLGKHSFKIFLPLSAHHGAPLEVTKYATNNMPKRSLSIKLKSGPNLDVLCLWELDPAPILRKLWKAFWYKTCKKRLNSEWWSFWCSCSQKCGLSGQYWILP